MSLLLHGFFYVFEVVGVDSLLAELFFAFYFLGEDAVALSSAVIFSSEGRKGGKKSKKNTGLEKEKVDVVVRRIRHMEEGGMSWRS